MLLDTLFHNESLENPPVPVAGGATETDDISTWDVYASPEASVKLVAVYACIYAIPSSVTQMLLRVMRETDGRVQPVRDHPLFQPVHNEPSA